MERENYISDIQEYWQYIQNGSTRSVKKAVIIKDITPLPPHRPHEDDWEQPWTVNHHQQPPYNDSAFYNDSWYGEHAHPPLWFHDGYRSYQDCDYYSPPSSYSRSKGGPDFHHRGRYDRFTPYHRERNTRNTPIPYSHQPPPKYQQQPLLKLNRGIH